METVLLSDSLTISQNPAFFKNLVTFLEKKFSLAAAPRDPDSWAEFTFAWLPGQTCPLTNMAIPTGQCCSHQWMTTQRAANWSLGYFLQ